jgi:D-beta-D-heptose 7-phosphate kinase/D-beta-D-heptose 1-phosphate adenosyltransferase
MTPPALKLNSERIERFRKVIAGFEKARVMVIGDFILDEFIWGSVTRISPEAPVPVVKVDRESFMPGGSLNVAHNAATLNGKVIPVGILGQDLYGRMLAKVMRQRGIDTGGVIYDKNRPTTLKTRIIAHHQQVVRFDKEHTEEIAPLKRKALISFITKKIHQVDAVIIEDYGKGMITGPFLKQIIQIAKKARKPIIVDPKEKHFNYYQGVTALTPNRYEAYTAVGLDPHGKASLEEVGRKLLKRLKLDCILVTLGEEGMALFEKQKVHRIPTAAKEVFDVSGAGDTVIAVFALAIAAGAKYLEAAMIANWAAGVVVGKLGTATLDRKELLRAVKAAGQ